MGRFWEGLGKPKSLIFTFFSMFFRSKIQSATRKGQKFEKKAKGLHFSASWCRVGGVPPLPGERRRERSWGRASVCGYPARCRSPSVGGGLKTPRGDHRRPPTFGFRALWGSYLGSWRSWRFWRSWRWAIRSHSWRFLWCALATIPGGIAGGIIGGTASRQRAPKHAKISKKSSPDPLKSRPA